MRFVLLSEVSAATPISGAERVLREQALGLRRAGHDVGLVTRAPAGDTRSGVLVGDIREQRYQPSRLCEPGFVLSSLTRSVHAFDKTRDGDHIDAAIIHQSLAGIGTLLGRTSEVHRWIYLCHSLAHEEYQARQNATGLRRPQMRRALNVRLRQWVERSVMRRCDWVIVLSDFMRKRVLTIHGIPEAKLRIIPGGANLEQFTLPHDPTELRQELKLPSDQIVLFTVRNLEARMGLENLIQAMARLRDDGQNVVLVIGGEGPLRPSLEHLIRKLDLTKRIELLGFIQENVLPKYYQAADLVVLPTQELEGFGLITVEALACGTPVLGTPVGAIPEVLSRVDPDLLTQGTDALSLANGIRKILVRFREEVGERQRIAIRGRKLVEEHYTWDRHARALEAIVEEGSSATSRNHQGGRGGTE